MEKTTVAEAVAAGEIPYITSKELYEAFMLIRASGDRMFLLKSDKTGAVGTTTGFKHTIFILSSSFGIGFDGIIVDGVNYSKNVVGYNIVAFAPDGKTISGSEGFQLFKNPDDDKHMADFLNGQPAGSYAAASVNYGPGVYLYSDAVSPCTDTVPM